MNRRFLSVALPLCLLIGSTPVLYADARAEQRTQFQFSGMLGQVVNLFGGRAAREGVKSTVVVKGDRKVTFSDPNSRQIIDLREEKIYDVDMEDKEYTVTTFEQLRRELAEARKRAEEDARRAQEKPAEKDPNAKEMEVDFAVRETGEKKQLNGFNTRQVMLTITLREKGKKVEESGGLILTSDVWLAPRLETMREINDFEIRYAKAVYGEYLAGASAQQMAAALAAHPMLKDALQKMREESGKLEGTPIMTTTTVDAVKSAEEMASQTSSSTTTQQEPQRSGGLAGAIAGLSRRGQARQEPQAPQQRATFMTTVGEVLSVSSEAPADLLTIPAGFKEDR